jgi:glycosyltransferase involved in cell wall biosynthesis
LTLSSKLRVCFPFTGDTVGGSHLSTLLLIKGLQQLDVDPWVVVHQTGGLLVPELERRGVTWRCAPQVRLVGEAGIAAQISGMVAASGVLAQFIRESGIEIVHVNDARMHRTWVLAAKRAGINLIWHQRSVENSRRLGFYSALADAKITVSEFCRRCLTPRMARDCLVIDNPFDIDDQLDRMQARQHLLEEYALPHDTYIVTFVGNFIKRKRPEFFVACAAELRRRLDANLFFPMLGDPRPDLRQEVEEAIQRAGIQDICKILGARFPIEPWLAGSDVLLAPARAEPFGRTLIEAMLVGTPVVASNDGGHAEIIGSPSLGLLVPPDDKNAFVEAVASLLRDSERAKQIAASAFEYARQRFSISRHASEVRKVYRAIRR